MLTGYFITGSDTGVGKTWISCQLIQQLKLTQHSVKVRKPVESGCEQNTSGQLQPADGLALFQANANTESLDIVTPYRLAAALAPDRAAKLANKKITLQDLTSAVENNINDTDTVLVEGAGGFYSPLTDDGLNSDLARALNLKVIIVIEDRLGTINQALMTINAVETEGLNIHSIILNQKHDISDMEMDNLTDLKSRTHYPVHQCLHQANLKDQVFDSD